MRAISVNVYRFEELSPEAQTYAWECFPDLPSDWGGEFAAVIAAFGKAFDLAIHFCEPGAGYGGSFGYVKGWRALAAPSGDPIRLARYIWNNFAEGVCKAKYYSTAGRWVDGKYHYKSRRSNIQVSMDDCPLTGTCFDCDILKPVIDCLHYKRSYNDIDELFDDCLTALFQTWEADNEYLASFEGFAEMCEANNYEFYESGELYA